MSFKILYPIVILFIIVLFYSISFGSDSEKLNSDSLSVGKLDKYHRFRLFGGLFSDFDHKDYAFNIHFNYRWSDFIKLKKSSNFNIFLSMEMGTKVFLIYLPNINIGPEVNCQNVYARTSIGIGYAFIFNFGVDPYIISPLFGLDLGYRTNNGVVFEISIFHFINTGNKKIFAYTLAVGLPVF